MGRTGVERALRKAEPHALLKAAQDTITENFAAIDVDLLMADYAMTILQPVYALPYTTEPISVNSGAPGRAFGSQQPYAEPDRHTSQVRLHLPVSVRGDRLGVLTVRLPADRYTPQSGQELQDIAEILGHAILVAERDADLYLQARRARACLLDGWVS
ncbi:hypothetical protein [Streptomyces sp. NPDC000229]|uniref:hypothetical protein n=1 Tax=Streptomyces sp. NPDC000229 TaxID=3154247 RepID=UPI003323035B